MKQAETRVQTHRNVIVSLNSQAVKDFKKDIEFCFTVFKGLNYGAVSSKSTRAALYTIPQSKETPTMQINLEQIFYGYPQNFKGNAHEFYGLSFIPKKMVIAQGAHETAYFTSKIFKDNKNAFGMKCPTKRVRDVYKCASNGYAYYDKVQRSVSDLNMWYIDANIRTVQSEFSKSSLVPLDKKESIQQYFVKKIYESMRNNVSDLESYILFLKKMNYFGDSYANYYNSVKSIYEAL